MTTLDDEVKIVARIQKLLELGSKNTNKAEAEQAVLMANKLMTQYNITNARIEHEKGMGDGKREKARTDGGFYSWQRELWESVAKLNFCLYWTRTEWVPATKRTTVLYGTTEMRKKRHQLVGRVVNVAATTTMATYLEEVIDRLLRETISQDEDPYVRQQQLNGSYAHAFRVGMAEGLIEKVSERYKSVLAKEQLKAEKAKRAAKRAASAGHSTSTALTLSDYIATEADANNDFLHGEQGYTAKKRAEEAAWEAEQARAAKEEEEAYTRWAKENPEEARKQAEEWRKQSARSARRRRGYSYRASADPRDKLDSGAYNRGAKAAAGVSIDPQMSKKSSRALT